MPTIDVWLTVVHGVKDTTAKDFHRSEKVFVHVPLKFKVREIHPEPGSDEGHSWHRWQSWLSRGDRQEFDHNLPAGAASHVERPMTVKDPMAGSPPRSGPR